MNNFVKRYKFYHKIDKFYQLNFIIIDSLFNKLQIVIFRRKRLNCLGIFSRLSRIIRVWIGIRFCNSLKIKYNIIFSHSSRIMLRKCRILVVKCQMHSYFKLYLVQEDGKLSILNPILKSLTEDQWQAERVSISLKDRRT